MSKTSRGLVTIIGALVIAVSFVAPTPAKAADEEGYDLMRQITSQWKHPVVLLVQDVSGSMSWPITTSSSRWYFDYDYDHQGTAYVEPDALYGGYGYGQGYWLKAGDLSSGGGGWQSYSGYVQKNHRKRVYAETNTLSQGTIITISGLGHDADNGTYKVATTPYHSGSYWHFKVYKQRSDGSFETTYHRFYFESWEWKKKKHWMTISVYTPPSPAEVLWYFVPPSRTAIVKSVLGSTVRTYQPAPSVQPAGTDSDGKPYYLFPAGSGPDATPASGACPPGLANNCGAYYDYPNDQWVGWNDHSYEPVPNPAVTVPSATGHWKDAKGNWDLTGSVIAKSGKDVNFGLIEYSGSHTTIRVVPTPTTPTRRPTSPRSSNGTASRRMAASRPAAGHRPRVRSTRPSRRWPVPGGRAMSMVRPTGITGPYAAVTISPFSSPTARVTSVTLMAMVGATAVRVTRTTGRAFRRGAPMRCFSRESTRPATARPMTRRQRGSRRSPSG